MKTYKIVEPGHNDQPIETIMTEQQILDHYYQYWARRMRQARKPASMITEANCIEDWVISHWATEVEYDTSTI